jgi:LysR family transcriptional regulator, regulator of abg operon
VARFRRHFPRSRVRVVEALGHELWPLVRDKTLDLAVSIKPDPKREPALRFRPLFAMDVAVVARKGHRLRNAQSLAQLADADWLTLLPPPTSGTPLDRIFSAVGLPGPRAVVECDSHTTMVALLAKSDMLGTLSRRLLANPLVRESLEEVVVAERLPALTVGIVTRAAGPLGPMEAVMARSFSAVARGHARPSDFRATG